MDFCQSCQVGLNTPEAYERLIYDASRGDSTYFTRWDEVAAAWEFVDKIAEAWKETTEDLVFFIRLVHGAHKAEELLARDGFTWWPVNGQTENNVTWIMQE